MSLLILFFFVGSQTAFLPWQYTETTQARIERILTEFPVIDGHNDFPMGIRELLRNDISKLDFDSDLTVVEPWASYWANHIDLPRMRKGQMGGQCFFILIYLLSILNFDPQASFGQLTLDAVPSSMMPCSFSLSRFFSCLSIYFVYTLYFFEYIYISLCLYFFTDRCNPPTCVTIS